MHYLIIDEAENFDHHMHTNQGHKNSCKANCYLLKFRFLLLRPHSAVTDNANKECTLRKRSKTNRQTTAVYMYYVLWQIKQQASNSMPVFTP